MDPLLYTTVKVFKYLYSEVCMQLVSFLVTMPIIRNKCIYYIVPILRYIGERKALTMFYARPAQAEVFGIDHMGFH